jgi:HSP20 family molecular chaperone IbpA
MALQHRKRMPTSDVESLFNVFGDLLNTMKGFGVPENQVNAWDPIMDVISTDKQIIVHAELPGVRKEVISLY